MFSELKHTPENTHYHKEHVEFFKDVHHNDVAFTDEKAFVLNDPLKQCLRRDPIAGKAPQQVILPEVNSSKRHDTTCSIRPFRS